MADDVDLVIPGTNEATAQSDANPTPIIDPATGEPTLAKPEGDTGQNPAPDVKKDDPKTHDADAALAVAARASKEARESKKQLTALQAELDALKAKPTGNPELEAKAKAFDEIVKNPSALFKHNWDADRMMKNILDPNAGAEAFDPEKFKAQLFEEWSAKNKPTPEQEEAQRQASQLERDASMKRAVDHVTGFIKSDDIAKQFTMVDADDAQGIVHRVEKFCIDKGFEPTREQAQDLIKQAIKGLHEKRMKRFGSKLTTPNSPVNTSEPGFTNGSNKPQYRTEPKPTAPASSGNPLPTKKPTFEIGFTQ